MFEVLHAVQRRTLHTLASCYVWNYKFIEIRSARLRVTLPGQFPDFRILTHSRYSIPPTWRRGFAATSMMFLHLVYCSNRARLNKPKSKLYTKVSVYRVTQKGSHLRIIIKLYRVAQKSKLLSRIIIKSY